MNERLCEFPYSTKDYIFTATKNCYAIVYFKEVNDIQHGIFIDTYKYLSSPVDDNSLIIGTHIIPLRTNQVLRCIGTFSLLV